MQRRQPAVQHLPCAGEIVLFDRSWYNRAGAERVMGFCTDEEYWVLNLRLPDKDPEVVGSPDPLIVGSPGDIYEAEELTGKKHPPL